MVSTNDEPTTLDIEPGQQNSQNNGQKLFLGAVLNLFRIVWRPKPIPNWSKFFFCHFPGMWEDSTGLFVA